MHPPNARELVGPQRDLHPDEQQVLDHFLGKNQEQAQAYFVGRGHYVTEFFAHMTVVGLRYYLPPFLEYLKSEDAKYEITAAASILGSLARRIENESPLPDDVLELAKQIGAYIKQHCKRFGIHPHDEWYREYIKTIEGSRLSGGHEMHSVFRHNQI